MKKRIIIATVKSWNIKNAVNLKKKFLNKYEIKIITKKEGLTYEKVTKIHPEHIFFPHWSWIIPGEIYNNFECIAFHMTDLPFGRGGSPLQNLILRGIKKTKISAIKVVKDLDAGPIYIKQPLSLEGSAEEIYKRASKIIFEDMIPYLLKNKIIPKPQRGKVVIFKRRSPFQSKIPYDITLKGIYDYIRMLDAEDYPSAFLETENLKFEFKDAQKRNKYIEAKVYIMERKDEK
jgi:methionyl-tRNA formyltransferase